VSLGWVDNHSGWFVDDDNRVILIQNVERDLLRRRPFSRSRNLPDHHDVALSQFERRLAIAVVHSHMPGVDRTAQRCAAKRRQLLGKKYVKPPARLVRRNRELLRPG
jgi:hypothetical protein